jgi:hypothetical protein
MIFIIVLSFELLLGTDHDLETCSAAPQRKHHSFFSPCHALCLGHFEFKSLLKSSSAFSNRLNLCHQTINRSNVRNWHKQVVFGTKFFLHSANLQVANSMAGFL